MQTCNRIKRIRSRYLNKVVCVSCIASFISFSDPSASASTFAALCEGGMSCSVALTASGVSGPMGTIPPGRVTYWGGGGESSTQVGTGIATTIIFGPIGALGFLAKKHKYAFTITGFDENGKQIVMQVGFVNKNSANRFMQEMPAITGLGMNQTRTISEIKESESRQLQQETLGPMDTTAPGSKQVKEQGLGRYRSR